MAINDKLTVAELRRTLALHTWLSASEFEEDPDGQEEEDESALAGVRWTTVTFSVEEVRKLVVATTLTLAQVTRRRRGEGRAEGREKGRCFSCIVELLMKAFLIHSPVWSMLCV